MPKLSLVEIHFPHRYKKCHHFDHCAKLWIASCNATRFWQASLFCSISIQIQLQKGHKGLPDSFSIFPVLLNCFLIVSSRTSISMQGVWFCHDSSSSSSAQCQCWWWWWWWWGSFSSNSISILSSVSANEIDSRHHCCCCQVLLVFCIRK